MVNWKFKNCKKETVIYYNNSNTDTFNFINNKNTNLINNNKTMVTDKSDINQTQANKLKQLKVSRMYLINIKKIDFKKFKNNKDSKSVMSNILTLLEAIYTDIQNQFSINNKINLDNINLKIQDIQEKIIEYNNEFDTWYDKKYNDDKSKLFNNLDLFNLKISNYNSFLSF